MERMHLVYPDPQFARRARTAQAVRRLAESLVAHHVADDDLDAVADWAEATAARLETGPAVARRDDYQKRRYTDPRPADGDRLISFTDRPFSGPANPSAYDLVIHCEGAEAVGVARFGKLQEASPGRAHGGVTASAFDDVMGYVMSIAAIAAYTGELTVRYLAPMPLHEPVTFRCGVAERDGRRWTVTGTATSADGTVVATGSARFAVVPPERFDLPADAVAPPPQG